MNRKRKVISILCQGCRNTQGREPGRWVSRVGTSGRDLPIGSSHRQSACNHPRWGKRARLSGTDIRHDFGFICHDVIPRTARDLDGVRVCAQS